MKGNVQFGEKKGCIYRSNLQNRGMRLSKDYKVNNLKNKDISVVCNGSPYPFTYKYLVTRRTYGP
jgi:hypothetical protein